LLELLIYLPLQLGHTLHQIGPGNNSDHFFFFVNNGYPSVFNGANVLIKFTSFHFAYEYFH